jgi:malonate transporter and related proteins
VPVQDAERPSQRPIQDTELAMVSQRVRHQRQRSAEYASLCAQRAGPAYRQQGTKMEVADLVLPVFAIIVTGWLTGWVGYISRSLADGLVHFAYNVAMPGLLVVTIAHESARNLLEWRFLLAFGGGSVLCFALVFLAVRIGWRRDLRNSTIYGMTAAMTNTGFVALPILHAIYGQPAVLPAAVATVFVAAVMFPATVILLELEQRGPHGRSAHAALLAKQIVLNPMVLSTLSVVRDFETGGILI